MSLKLFEIKLTSILGNSQRLDGGAMFGNAPKSVWEKWYPPDEQSRIHLSCRCLLIEVNNKKILLEAGIGAFFSPKLKDRFGVLEEDHILLKSLLEHNISHDQIDYVILSHLHFDHAGGILADYKTIEKFGPSLLFPNARFIIGEEAYNRAKKPHFRDRASFIDFLPKLLEDSKRLTLLPNGSTLLSDIISEDFADSFEFIYTNGHTPGHAHTLVRGSKEKVFFAGDLIPGVAWLHLPITMGYDRYAEMVIDEKQMILNRAIKEDWQIYFTHDVNVAMSKVQLNHETHKYSSKDPISSLCQYII